MTASELDALPYPDFDDYFARLRRSPLEAEVDPLLFFETSRGCWWGEKHHCAFCGLNGSRLAFRSKSPRRAVDELEYLVRRHGVHRACSADNILDYRYFKTLLPLLEAAKLDFNFVCEMKCNLTRAPGRCPACLPAWARPSSASRRSSRRAQPDRQGRHGRAQPANAEVVLRRGHRGEVEPALRLSRREARRLRGAGRAAAVAGITWPRRWRWAGCAWTGSRRISTTRRPRHGQPASQPGVRLRVSVPPDVLARLAYYYEYDYADGRDPRDYVGPVLAAVERWQELARTVTLRMADGPDGVLFVHDTRPGAAVFQRRLAGVERAVYEYCDTARSAAAIARFASQCPAARRCAGDTSPDARRVGRRANHGPARRPLRQPLATHSVGWVEDHRIAATDGTPIWFASRLRSTARLAGGRGPPWTRPRHWWASGSGGMVFLAVR